MYSDKVYGDTESTISNTQIDTITLNNTDIYNTLNYLSLSEIISLKDAYSYYLTVINDKLNFFKQSQNSISNFNISIENQINAYISNRKISLNITSDDFFTAHPNDFLKNLKISSLVALLLITGVNLKMLHILLKYLSP